MEHELKCWPESFKAKCDGLKPWCIRKDDRPFEVGDTIIFREWRPDIYAYTGNELTRHVAYIMRGEQAETFGCKPGYCIMTLAE